LDVPEYRHFQTALSAAQLLERESNPIGVCRTCGGARRFAQPVNQS